MMLVLSSRISVASTRFSSVAWAMRAADSCPAVSHCSLLTKEVLRSTTRNIMAVARWIGMTGLQCRMMASARWVCLSLISFLFASLGRLPPWLALDSILYTRIEQKLISHMSSGKVISVHPSEARGSACIDGSRSASFTFRGNRVSVVGSCAAPTASPWSSADRESWTSIWHQSRRRSSASNGGRLNLEPSRCSPMDWAARMTRPQSIHTARPVLCALMVLYEKRVLGLANLAGEATFVPAVKGKLTHQKQPQCLQSQQGRVL